MDNARIVVASALTKMESSDSWSNLTLDSALKRSLLSPQDKPFATKLFYGVVSRKITLDTYITAYSKTKLNKIDMTVLNILRCAIYQILYMDIVPDRAAVNEAVNITRKMKFSSASGFVNGLLRSFLREDKKMPAQKLSTKTLLSVEYSCPKELVKLFVESYGEERTKEILEESLSSPATFLRVNTLKIDSASLIVELAKLGILACEMPELPNCLVLESSGNIQDSEIFKNGYFHIQDYSSQSCAVSLGAKAGQRILDCCAAPGGKTFIIAQEMENKGDLVACDLHEHRLTQLEARAERLGISNLTTFAFDMTEHRPDLGEFDKVLCDVPCSGLGVIRRRPEIKYKPLADFEKLPSIQFDILCNGAKYCKIGGLLVYSTCTLSLSENGGVVKKFLDNNPSFVLEGEEQTLFPSTFGSDGFYIAHLRRNN